MYVEIVVFLITFLFFTYIGWDSFDEILTGRQKDEGFVLNTKTCIFDENSISNPKVNTPIIS